MKKIISSVLLLAMLSLILLACTSETDTEGAAIMPDPPAATHVAGTWLLVGDVAYTFHVEGTGIYHRGATPVQIRWSIVDSILRICHTPDDCPSGYCNEPYDWSFSLTGENSVLTITSRHSPGRAFTMDRHTGTRAPN